MDKLLKKVVVLSFAITDRGYPFETPWRKITVDAFKTCLDQTTLKVEDIQCGSIAYNERTISEAALGTQVADCLGLPMKCSMTPVSHACCGGGLALYNVWHYIASGRYDVGLVMTMQCSDLFDSMEAMNPIGNHSDYDYMLGFSHVEYSYLRDVLYREKYHYDVTPSAKWAEICHQFARKTPGSTEYGKDMPTWEDLAAENDSGERARSATARGSTATATLLVSEDKARELGIVDPITCYVSYAFRPPYIGNHFFYVGDPNYVNYDIAEQPAIMEAAKEVYKDAGITASDIDVALVHDLSGFEGMMSLEGLGICPIGEGGKFVMNGETKLGGKCPTNTHGGGIAYGHTSVGSDFQINMFEGCLQLQGKATGRQVEGAKIAVAQSYGTHHSLDIVAVLKKGELNHAI